MARAVGREPRGEWYQPLPSMSHHLLREQVSSTSPLRTRGGQGPTFPSRPVPEWWAAHLARECHLLSSRTCGPENPREATHRETARAPAGSSSQTMPPAHSACPRAPEFACSGMEPLGAAAVAPCCTAIWSRMNPAPRRHSACPRTRTSRTAAPRPPRPASAAAAATQRRLGLVGLRPLPSRGSSEAAVRLPPTAAPGAGAEAPERPISPWGPSREERPSTEAAAAAATPCATPAEPRPADLRKRGATNPGALQCPFRRS